MAMDSDTAVNLGYGVCIKATRDSVLISFPNGKQKWIPQSQIHDDSEVYKEGHSGKVIITKYWADKNGLT